MNSDLRRRFQRLVRVGIVMVMPVLLIVIFSITGLVLAKEQSQEDNASSVKQELPTATPVLAEIIPLATQISGRLIILEKEVKNMLDGAAFKKNYDEIEVELNNCIGELKNVSSTSLNSPSSTTFFTVENAASRTFCSS